MNTIGENIALLRKQKEMTQEALANAIGVSNQSVSKWENNTTMPDISLLPIISDIFSISIDELFSRKSANQSTIPVDGFEYCNEKFMENIFSCFPTIPDEPFDKAFSRYKASMESDSRLRSGIIEKRGVVYYRGDVGGLILKKPKGHWYELLKDKDALEILSLAADKDFCRALCEIIRGNKSTFTVPSLCVACKIENASSLREKLMKSKLFSINKVEIDGKEIEIFELSQSQRLFLIFALFTYAKEFALHENIFMGFCGDGGFYSD